MDNSNVKKDIFISYKSEVLSYPSPDEFYNPELCYPEYPFGTGELANSNPVYEMIRELFHGLGFDKEHYGTSEWNPLGDIINKGDTVMIKPNWVMHINESRGEGKDNLDCLVTHPSVVRAVVDYVWIALKGTGNIVVADAPMQDCNLELMFKKAGYNSLFRFWGKYMSAIQIKDLRKYASVFKRGVIVEKKFVPRSSGPICINLGKDSLHYNGTEKNKFCYKVSDYSSKLTNMYHNNSQHIYEINADVLKADVFINLSKPKCHRLAGMTAAMKNMVGITYEKASLPHRKTGDAEHGGDAYKKRSLFKEWMQICDEKKTVCYENRQLLQSHLYGFFEKAFYVFGSITSGDAVRVGGWYGNDTIWRTVIDLNQIIQYADKDGKMQKKKQRNMLCIGDMIIAGQGNGPLSPSPKPLGMVLISQNANLFDQVVCRIMGFNPRKIKGLSDENALKVFGLSEDLINQYYLQINDEPLSDISEFSTKNEWKFEAHDMWKGYIEQ